MKIYNFLTETEYINYRTPDFKEWAKNDVKSYLKDPNWHKENRHINNFNELVNYLMAGNYTLTRLKEIAKNGYKFDLSDDGANRLIKIYYDTLFRQFDLQNKARAKAQTVYNKYQPLLEEVNELLAKLDLSHIPDGFPCGSAFVYLTEPKHELAQAIKILFNSDVSNDKSVNPFKHKLPLKFQSVGQCIDYERKQCDIAQAFLTDHDLPVATYSWLD